MKKIILLLSLATFAFATAAYKGVLSFKQPDGSAFEASLKGDEWFHWIETEKGHIITYNNDSKNYEYVELIEENGVQNIVASGYKVGADIGSYALNQSKIDATILSDIWKQKKETALAPTQRPVNDSCHSGHEH